MKGTYSVRGYNILHINNVNLMLTKHYQLQALAYLWNIAVDNTMPVVHNKVIQLLVGNVVK